MRSPFTDVIRSASKSAFLFKQNSPRIMFVAGLVSVGAGTVLACRATLKIDKVLDEAKVTLHDINTVEHETYTSQDRIQDRTIVYTQTIGKLFKLYAPAIVVGGVGVACLTGSHNILQRRNAALTAAYVSLERTYKAYRARVRQDIGEDREAELHYEVVRKQADQIKVDESKLLGKLPKKIPGYGQFAKFFDEASPNFTRSPEQNFAFLKSQEYWANDKLNRRGYLMLNEVYEALGIPATQAGAVVGWILEGGVGYVDFGIFSHRTDQVRAFVNGHETSVLLDFNVDGIIHDKIER